MLGSGVGTNGAGGPGILHTLGTVAAATPLLPLVTGVLGGLMATVPMGCSGVTGRSGRGTLEDHGGTSAGIRSREQQRERALSIPPLPCGDREHRQRGAGRGAEVSPPIRGRDVA